MKNTTATANSKPETADIALQYIREHETMLAEVGENDKLIRVACIHLAHCQRSECVRALEILSEGDPDNVYIQIALDECHMWQD